MSRGYPSMTALLGLLAVAGYQNRDKIAELLNGLGKDSGQAPGSSGPNTSAAAPTSGQGGLGGLLGGVGAAGVGGLLANGLGELVEHFTKGGHGETANSWIDKGQNRDIPEADLEKAIGSDTIETLTRETGLSRSELLSRLSRDLPTAIDRYTPDGRVPA